jgi:pyridoxine kinase
LNILSIQSWVSYGHVGNAAAVFPLQRLGAEVWPIHTVQFSNHPGHGTWQGQVFEPALIRALVDGIAARGALASCDAVLSGYLGRAGAGEAVLAAAEQVRSANSAALYCCDPVIGDAERGIYVAADLAAFIRDHALPQADIATPNPFELAWLTGMPCQSLDGARGAMARLAGAMRAAGPRAVLLTGLRSEQTPVGCLDTLALEGEDAFLLRTPELNTRVHGAGDVLAALFLYHRLAAGAAKPALESSVSALFGVLRRTAEAGAPELLIVEAQEELVAPSQRFTALPC